MSKLSTNWLMTILESDPMVASRLGVERAHFKRIRRVLRRTDAVLRQEEVAQDVVDIPAAYLLSTPSCCWRCSRAILARGRRAAAGAGESFRLFGPRGQSGAPTRCRRTCRSASWTRTWPGRVRPSRCESLDGCPTRACPCWLRRCC